MHWCERYIGLPYKHGELDCARLLTKVRSEVFSGAVPDEVEAKRAASRLGRAAQMEDAVAEYGVKTDNPQEGDAVLMICMGRPSHIGVFCRVNGEDSVLHAMENAGHVVLHRIRDIERFALKVEGYYTWK